MITCVLFIWLSAGTPMASWNYDTEAECKRDGKSYARYVCVKVVVPNT